MADFGIVALTHPKIAQGMDYWRILVPFVHMAHVGYPVKVTRLGNDLPTFGGEAPYVLVVSEPFASTHGEDRKTKAFCHKLGILYVVDIADDPTPLDDSPMQRGAGLWDAKLECIAEADLVTCPTPAMREILLRTNPHVEVIPDLAEAAHWDGPTPTDRPSFLTVGVRGGSTHARDWEVLEEPWRRLSERYPELHFVSCGLEVDWMKRLPPERYHHRGWALIDRYQESIKWIDLGCAPLSDSRFNLSKSPIAYYDFSLAGAYTVATKSSIYDEPIEASLAGSLVHPSEWFEVLSYFVEDGTWRKQMTAEARRWVVANRCMNAQRCAEREAIYRTHWSRVYGAEVPYEPNAVLPAT